MTMSTNTRALVRITSLTAAVTLALSLAPTLDAQSPPQKASPGRIAKILEDFDNRIREIDRLVQVEESKKAYKQVNRLRDEMINGFISGQSVSYYLGATTVLRALAAYQLGQEGEALWYWHVATQLFPDFLKQDMAAYGDAGRFLASHPLPEELESEDCGSLAEADAEDACEEQEDVEPPRKKRSPRPDLPAAKRGSGRVSVIVQAVIGVDGRPRGPRILDSKGELTLVVASLDALRRWEFKPAERDGEPVEVYYNLAVNFSL